MLSNGNIVFSRQFGASEITRDKKIVWKYDAPPGTEIHTAYPNRRSPCSDHAKRESGKTYGDS